MTLYELISAYANYNKWANEQIINWLGKQPYDLLAQDMPSSFPSVNHTLKHVWESQVFYLSILSEKEAQYGKGLSFKSISHGLLDSSRELVSFIANLGAGQINDLRNVNRSDVKADRPISEFYLQCMNHSTYHRGQIVTMGHNLGLTKAPATDYYRFMLSEGI